MMKNFYIFAILTLWVGCAHKEKPINGYVEAEYRYIGPTTSGILKSLYVHAGDFIRAKNIIFEIDNTELKANLENAKSKIVELESSLKDNLKDYSITKSKLEAAQQSAVAAQKKLSESAPQLENDFYVENTFFSPGEFIPAGKPVVSLFSLSDIKIRFFVPEHKLPHIKLNQLLIIYCDGCTRPLKAKISRISNFSEYTPPVIYSVESRPKMVFMVEAKPEEGTDILHPGLPVDIEIVDG